MKSLLPLALTGLLALSGCATVQTQIEINAPAKTVSKVLYNFDAYPQWNPFLVKVDGTVKEDQTVTVTVKREGKDPISGATKVNLTDPKHLAWTGSLAVPGVFSGHHEFIIEEVGPNKVIFHQNESMSGLAVPLLDKKPVIAGFEAMNEALKKQAEAAK